MGKSESHFFTSKITKIGKSENFVEVCMTERLHGKVLPVSIETSLILFLEFSELSVC